jgi:hypothetical protein
LNLHQVFDSVADDLAYFSRRELEPGLEDRKQYTLRAVSVSAAMLLRQLTGSDRELPGVMLPTIETSKEIIVTELSRSGGDVIYF